MSDQSKQSVGGVLQILIQYGNSCAAMASQLIRFVLANLHIYTESFRTIIESL